MVGIPRKQARSALLEAALGRLSEVGPVRTHPNEICQELGLSKALVNYHFGNREGLIREVIAVGYERYVDHLTAVAAAAGPAAIDRLLAWVEAQIDWTVANPGLAAALDFPTVLGGEPSGDGDALAERIAEAGRRNFANLLALVVEARREAIGTEPDPFETGLDGSIVGWLTLGVSVWISGRHLPTRALGYAEYLPSALDRVRAVVAELVTRPVAPRGD